MPMLMSRTLHIATPVAVFCAFVLVVPVVWAEEVNVNAALAEELAETLDGVGDHRAEAIIEEREANGPFTDADDLTRVSGVGPVTVEENRNRMSFGEAE
ncbi:MAG: ComEA family DNA-binding protein [Halorhodospira sp.]